MRDLVLTLPDPSAVPLRDLDPAKCVSLDYETFSLVNLKKSGASRYARDPSTEVLMLAWSMHDSDEVHQWVPAIGESRPAELMEILEDPEMTFFAWNAPFEMVITEHVLGVDIPITQWRDVMALAHTLSFPGKLEKVGEILKLADDKAKMTRGSALIRKFCGPRKPTKNLPHTRADATTDPEDWIEFLEYNKRDVVAEKEILSILKKYDMPVREWDLWHLDQKINNAGIPINLNMVRSAQRLADRTIKADLATMKEITGLQNPNSNAQLLPWLRDRGYPYEDMRKVHVEKAYEEFKAWERSEVADVFQFEPELGEVLRLRLRVSKSSVKKFPALLEATDPDGNGAIGRLRGAHQFAGAGRTWRWSGRKFQPQNLPRPEKYLEDQIPQCARDVELLDPDDLALLYENPMDVLTGVVRPAVQPPFGYRLVDADLSAIENVVLGWLAREEKILQVFWDDRDPYIDFATDMFGFSYSTIDAKVKSGDKTMRTTAKPGVLGCLKGDTPVLTPSGWKAVVELTADDLVHDGTGWVSHGGIAYMGRQDVLCRSGIYATRDHKFLVGEDWVEWGNVGPEKFRKARSTADGLLSDTLGHPDQRGGNTYADVRVDSSQSSQGQTCFAGFLPSVGDALLGTVAPLSESESEQTCMTPSQIVTMLRNRVARTRKTVSTDITEDGEFLSGSIPQMSGLSISSMSSVPTGFSKSTESTTTETMPGGISASLRDPSKTGTSDTWDILNTGDYARFVVLTDDGCLVAHNCGYMLGPGAARVNSRTGETEATGLLGYAWNMGVSSFTPELSKLSVETFRGKYSKVVEFWWDLDRAARRLINTGEMQTVGYLVFDMKGPFMRIRLPSGRYLHYSRPKLLNRMTPWGEMRKQVTYENLENNHWRRVTTHPGKLAENVTQAVARDILANGMFLADRNGLDIRLHVHDQIVAVSPECSADEDLDVLLKCMTTLPSWANSKLPLKAAGQITDMFLKD